MYYETIFVLYTPQQNGVVEHNITQFNITRFLKTMRVTKFFCIKAVKTIYYMINQSSSIGIGFMTMMEMWKGKLNVYSSLHVFGYPTYVQISTKNKDGSKI